MSRWFREWAFLNKGLKIRLVDEREEDRDVTYQYEGGIRDFVEHINEAKDPVHKTIFYLEREAIVILTADHGDMDGAHQLHAKGAVAYREQNHVPLIVAHPAYRAAGAAARSLRTSTSRRRWSR